MKLSDVKIYTCETTGISELYWEGGRVSIDLGNDVDEVFANKIYDGIKNHEALVQQNEALLKQRQNISKSAHFHIGKLLKHNDITSHDREMMRQLLEKIND
jgi:hypothetical protein